MDAPIQLTPAHPGPTSSAHGQGFWDGYRSREHVVRSVAAVVLVLGIVVSLIIFLRNNTARIMSQNEEYLSEFTTQRADSVSHLFEENLGFIESTAYLYGESLDAPEADQAKIIEFERNGEFEMLRFIDAEGNNHTSTGLAGNLADRAYFQDGMAGNSGVMYVAVSRVTGQRQLGFYAPVRWRGTIIGVMVGFYGEEHSSRLLSYSLFGQEGVGWLCDKDGTTIATTLADAPDNYFDYLATTGKLDPQEIERLQEAFAQGVDVSYTHYGEDGRATDYAAALDSVDWMLIRSFPPAASEQILARANREGIRLLTEIALLFGSFVLVVAVTFVLERRRLSESVRDAADVSQGVSTLFEKFVVVDLRSGTFHYAGGLPSEPNMPHDGQYQQFCKAIFDRIPEADQYTRAVKRFSPEHLRIVLAKHDSYDVRVHAPTATAEWLTYHFVVLERDEAGIPVRLLSVCQDVSVLHDHEVREQQRLQNALDTAEKASRAKTEFLFNMSHDLRTPLNAIIGYTELASRDGVSVDVMREYVSKIDSSSEHLLALINDILEMSRIESGKMTLEPEPCDLVTVMDDVYEMFATQMQQKGLDFAVDTSAVADRWVLADCNRLNRIALNLVSNAFKFTEPGGLVEVRLSQEGRELAYAQVDGAAPLQDGDSSVGSYVLRVRDSGIGISEEFVERLFSAFERERTSTVSRTQGTGLGLSITKRIVDMMGGSIEVSTKLGVGTEFTVRLAFPLVEEEELPADTQAEGVHNFAGKRVLLVEDNALNREIASLLLTDIGFELEYATNGQEAVEAVTAAEPGYFDLVLMDVQMPIMDGYAATRAIRALADPQRAQVPIVAMTANAFAEDVQAAHDAQMNDHIAKPLDIDVMCETLARVLQRP